MRKGANLAAKIPAWQNLVYQYALLGKCYALQGKLDECRAALSDALHVLKAQHMNSAFDQVEYLTAVAILNVALADRMEDPTRRTAVREARRASYKAVRYARQVAGWLPEALRLQGTSAWLSGDREAARKRWCESIAVAEKYEFPVECARTLMEIGHRTGDIDLVERASQVFEQSGAKVFLALALHSLAQLRSRLSTDTGSAIISFGKAIAALQEVEVEYELGVACRQRAYLYKRLGQLDRAASDLRKAQDCFDAVGLAFEQAEVVREENAINVS